MCIRDRALGVSTGPSSSTDTILSISLESNVGYSTGQAIHDHWMRLLTAQSVESGDLISAETRRQATDYLLMLSCALQNDFPEETLWEPGEDFEAAVASIVSKGAEELRADLYDDCLL